MCRTSLFHYAASVVSGPPDETCLRVIIDPMQRATGAIGAASHAVGIISLFIYFVHFFMYNRGYTADPNW